MTEHCAYCYRSTSELKKCGKCHKRKLCSPECAKKDWNQGHKHYCGKSGEINVDFEIKPSPGKGLGLFALRPFEYGDRVLVERPIVLRADDLKDIPAETLPAVNELEPRSGTLEQKFHLNGISHTEAGFSGGLYVTVARINHDCFGNTSHLFKEDHGVKLVCAMRRIEAGEEITFRYTKDYKQLKEHFKIDCTCGACKNPELKSKLKQLDDLDEQVLQLSTLGKPGKALDAANSLLKLYGELKASKFYYGRTYYDMFQAALSTKSTLPQTIEYIAKTIEFLTPFYGEDSKEILKFKELQQKPETHNNYLIVDKVAQEARQNAFGNKGRRK